MNDLHDKPTLRNGAMSGLLITAPLVALFYLAASLFGTPFVPFDLFDWLARVLPGGIVTFGIDFIISIIAALNLEDLSSTAKIAEQIMAIFLFLVIGAAAGVGLFSVLRRAARADLIPGLVFGAVTGALIAILSVTINQSATADSLISLAWILAAFVAWGAALAWVYQRLAARSGAYADMPLQTGETASRLLVSVQVVDRRNFLVQLGGASAAVTLVGAGVGALLGRNAVETTESISARPWSADHPLPNADAALQPAPGTRPEFTPVNDHYRIDINALPPVIREENWTLKIDGLVAEPLELTLQQIQTDYTPVDQFITLSCISNGVGGELISTQRWTGVPLKDILRDARPDENARALHIISADGFDEYLSRSLVNTDERIMLAYAWDGLPLPLSHGFPLRIYIPDRYGMKQPKWITRIELVENEDEGYWVRRGWDEVAKVKMTSVVDTVASDALVQADGQTLVPIGGIAYAGAQGIRKVEVRVDDGGWTEAQLRTPISDLTWVIWRYDWPFQTGEHTFYVRCVDGRGVAQEETVRDTRPSGATRIHRRRATL
jgi:DMSO/TMAO reductase YedYZ molybdopterin-dependent catalytic subunit